MNRRQASALLLGLLSDREFHVLARIAKGQALSKIARELGISQEAVAVYRRRLLAKLKLQTNAELVLVAHSAGLVQAPKLPQQ